MADEEVKQETEEQTATVEEGLLDTATVAEAKTDTPEEEPSHIDPESEGKPNWLPERFWNDDKGADYEGLAKSQDELYRKLRGGKHQTPENEEYDLKFLGETVEPDDILLNKFKTVAAERGLTQDDFESIVGTVRDTIAENVPDPEEAKFDRQQELEQLGPNGEDIINGHVKWAQSLVERGAWTDDDFEEFKVWGGTASGIKALSRLRQYYGEKTIPVQVTPDGSDIPTDEELQGLIADPKYETDPGYRQKVYKKLNQMNPRAEGHMPTLG
jgi:hypothetical protein